MGHLFTLSGTGTGRGEDRGESRYLFIVAIIVAFLIYGLATTGPVEEPEIEDQTAGGQGPGSSMEGTPTTTPQSDLNVSDGSVVPEADYYANVTLLGTEFGEDVAVRFDVGGEIHDPWPGNVNDGNNPRSHVIENETAGGPISVIAEWPGNETIDSTDDDPRVRVLRNGDPVPDVAGLGDQPSASEILAPYTNDGAITLQPNQAIFLFELYTTNTSDPAFDLQDAVVLATIRDEA